MSEFFGAVGPYSTTKLSILRPKMKASPNVEIPTLPTEKSLLAESDTTLYDGCTPNGNMTVCLLSAANINPSDRAAPTTTVPPADTTPPSC